MTEEPVDTGFEDVLAGGPVWEEAPPAPEITVAVTTHIEPPAPPPEPGLTQEGKQAAKALVQLPPIPTQDLARLAREIAMDIRERHLVLAEHKLTEAQYDYLETQNEFFVQALKVASMEWHSPLSTQERIKLEAAAILEDALPGLGARLQNPREQLSGVVETAKLFAKVAGVGEREVGAVAPGERFTINIDLGGDQKVVVSTGPAPNQLASTDHLRAIQQDPEKA